MNDLITRNTIINRLSQKYSGNARDDLGRLMGNSRDKSTKFFLFWKYKSQVFKIFYANSI